MEIGSSQSNSQFTILMLLITAVLHTIFFHRYFPTLRPSTVELFDLTLPYVSDSDLESLIDTRVHQLTRQLSSLSPNSSPRGQIGVQFFERKRRKAATAGIGTWFGVGGGNRAEEDVCWEVWRLEITLATPKTELGRLRYSSIVFRRFRGFERS